MTLIERIAQAEMAQHTQYAREQGYLGPRTQCAEPAPPAPAWDDCIPFDDSEDFDF